MKIAIKNLGALKEADFEIGDLTVLCGQNNTGKTYITHATYGFLRHFHRSEYAVDDQLVERLVSDGSATLTITKDDLEAHLDRLAERYSDRLDHVFSGSGTQFKDAQFRLTLEPDKMAIGIPEDGTSSTIGRGELSISGQRNNDELVLDIGLDTDDRIAEVGPRGFFFQDHVKRRLAVGIGHYIAQSLGGLVPKPFIASAERTGAAIFHGDVFANSYRLVQYLRKTSGKGVFPDRTFGEVSGKYYPLAVDDDLRFIQSLPNLARNESYLLQKHPTILADFTALVGGEYQVNEGGDIRFVPTADRRLKLGLTTSSGAVRSLLDIAFYLKHVAREHDLLMIDEPELNLHPGNQRRIARLIARLVNAGIKVFITTHSDYIVSELSLLIELNQDDKRLKQLARDEGYDESELLKAGQVKAYITAPPPPAKNGTSRKISLAAVDVSDEYGINATSFDSDIEDMNRIQDEITWGE